MKSKVLLIWLAMLLFVAGSVKAQTMHPKREFRGAWIQCVNGQFQGMPTEQMKATLIRQLDNLKGAGINAIIFQVRAECDALYASTYEPWSRFLTGLQGKAPQLRHCRLCILIINTLICLYVTADSCISIPDILNRELISARL